MIWLAVSERESRSLRLISMRPELSVGLVPSTPTNELRLSTSGSFRMTAARACWRPRMASNDTVCGASVTAWIRPLSWIGKNPLGIMM
jgi:hypothetical protein